MLRNSDPSAKPEIQREIDKLLLADANFDRYENRSVHRENLVRPVRIEMRETEEIVLAFSRNISGSGIGVITHEQVASDSIAVLNIASLDGEDTRIVAGCRWCKPFGAKWYLSGWQFIGLQR
jgi:hypothetical protein